MSARLRVEVDFGRLSTEVLEDDDWNEYLLDWDSQERLCYMVGAEDESTEEVELPTEMQAMVDQMEAHLPPQAEVELKKMLQEHRDVFALEGEQLGRTGWVKHAIRLNNETPILQAAR
jgi:hypothetical protein